MTSENKSARINALKRQRSAIDAEIVRLGGDIVGYPMWECLRCGHKWASTTALPPKQCPAKGCRTPYWDRPRGQTRAERAVGAETEVPRVGAVDDGRRTKTPPDDARALRQIGSQPIERMLTDVLGTLPPDLPPPPSASRAVVAAPVVETVPASDEIVIEQDFHRDENSDDDLDAEPDANDHADEADADGNQR